MSTHKTSEVRRCYSCGASDVPLTDEGDESRCWAGCRRAAEAIVPRCPKCKGSGTITVESDGGHGGVDITRTCEECKGTGAVPVPESRPAEDQPVENMHGFTASFATDAQCTCSADAINMCSFCVAAKRASASASPIQIGDRVAFIGDIGVVEDFDPSARVKMELDGQIVRFNRDSLVRISASASSIEDQREAIERAHAEGYDEGKLAAQRTGSASSTTVTDAQYDELLEKHRTLYLENIDLKAMLNKSVADVQVLAKAVLAAHEALNIDMGDGEPTYQCCNSVCGHCRCLIGDALEIAEKHASLKEDDLASMNKARRFGGLPPIPATPCAGSDSETPAVSARSSPKEASDPPANLVAELTAEAERLGMYQRPSEAGPLTLCARCGHALKHHDARPGGDGCLHAPDDPVGEGPDGYCDCSIFLAPRPGEAKFNHSRSDGPFDPCRECFYLMSKDQLMALADDLRARLDEQRSERNRP